MAPNDNDDSQTSSDSDNAFGRLRNPGVGSTEFESHDDEAVEQFSERLREEKNTEPDEAPEPVEEQNVESSEVEDLVLDALDSEAEVDVDAEADQSAGVRDTEAELGDAEPADDESHGDRPIDETDTGTSAGVREQPEDEQSDDGDAAGQVCPSCESVSPPGMRFCVQCGESLRDNTGETATRSSKGRDQQKSSVPTLDRDKLDSQFPTGFELVTINDDGTDGRAIPVRSAKTILGRDGDTRFPTDEFLNPRHARLTIEDGKFFIEDLHSLNGTFLKLRGEVRLQPGDTFLMGRQVLRFEKIEQDFDSKKTSDDGTRYMGSPAPGGDYKILQIGVGNIVQNIYCLPDSGVVLGREKGDIIFKDDKFMSGRHARIFTDDQPHLADLNSSNGTWIKLWEKTELKQDDYIFMGQQLFRVELPE